MNACSRCCAPPAARSPAARDGAPRARSRLPGVRQQPAPDRRGRGRDAGVRASLVQGDPPRAPAAGVRVLRADRTGARADPPDRPRAAGAGTARARAGEQVRRPPAAVPPGGDLRAPGHRARALDAGRLGRREREAARTTGASAARSRAGGREAARRRHAGAGAAARTGNDQDRAAVDVRARRQAGGQRGAACGMDALHAGPQGGAPRRTPGRVQRHPAGRRLRGVRAAVRDRADSGGGLLGARTAQVLRHRAGDRFADRQGGDRPDR